MNILPKKRWHVRTKENIARVRRDEANARKEEEDRVQRIELAEKEARTDFLRSKARTKYDGRSEDSGSQNEKSEHVNFFKELELGEDVVKGKNKEYEKETKEESEKYEKQIGYLTYLGQDTVESTGKVSWFNKVPERLKNTDDSEVDVSKKWLYDPMEKINHFFGNKYSHKTVSSSSIEVRKNNEQKNNSRKRKSCSSCNSNDSRNRKEKKKRLPKTAFSGSDDEKVSEIGKQEDNGTDVVTKEKSNKAYLKELRAKRLKREQAEKTRAAELLARLCGEPAVKELKPPEPSIIQKYNSQFNPHIARQNRDE